MSPERLEGIIAREYPRRGDAIFMNAASWGLLPVSAAETAASLTLSRNRALGFTEDELGPWHRRCRAAAAALVGVTPAEVSLSANTSYGVNLAAALVEAGAPGTVVVSDGEFPANVLPWRALEPNGFRVEMVPRTADGWPDEEALLRALEGDDVRALAVSAVQYLSGYRVDLPRLGAACQARGDVLFCVDAIQALGAVPLDARAAGIDVLATGGQKWLCSPWGSGFTFIRRDLQERFSPPMVGWLSVRGATRFEDGLAYGMDWLDDGRKFELATLALQDHLGMARSIEVFMEIGLEHVEAHILRVQAPLLEWIAHTPGARLVTPGDRTRRAGIVTFRLPDLDDAVKALRDGGVIFSVREGAIRLAPHVYNTVDEMTRVVELLDRR